MGDHQHSSSCTHDGSAPESEGAKMLKSLFGSAPPSDLTPEQIEENKRLVADRLERERQESALYLSGEKTLGPAYVRDEDIVPFEVGHATDLPDHEVASIAKLADEAQTFDGAEILEKVKETVSGDVETSEDADLGL